MFPRSVLLALTSADERPPPPVVGAGVVRARRDLRCAGCGYGVSASRAPARCPMCGDDEWEAVPAGLRRDVLI
jgi:rubrerythrin